MEAEHRAAEVWSHLSGCNKSVFLRKSCNGYYLVWSMGMAEMGTRILIKKFEGPTRFHLDDYPHLRDGDR
ncbi:hypothetical protein Nepgr_025519 [Nepenthes gracilis]|uniref:Uncharacterized protein n=1 Tax=Nepenthes gracilis TaxID=150966 RepID=A0AAD3T7Y5_NEPGR|nr:hypothetical protein Nepgr_025519 [Nepenthes gracilis]